MNRFQLFVLFCFVAIYAQNEPYVLGADISWIQQKENTGVLYYHNGTQIDPFNILKEHGFNYIRLRLFVDPTAIIPGESESPYSESNYCSLDSTIKMAKRVKTTGMKFLLDFHYSDTWADPGKQYKPISWQNLTTITGLTEKVRSYTKESLERFKAEGVLPDMVQIGNEAVSGMIWPEGRNYTSGGKGSRANFAALVNAGIDGVRDVSQDIKIMVHTINKDNPNGWLTNLINDGVSRIDVLGLSYYSEWHGQPDSLERVANAFIARNSNNSIKFAVAEYADNHRRVNDIVFSLPENKRFGTFVWEPFDWRDVLFDWKNNPSGRHSNERLQLYPKMAIDYAPSSSSLSSSSSSSNNTTSILLTQVVNDNAVVEIYTLNGIRVNKPLANLPKGVYIVKISSGGERKVLKIPVM